MQWTYVLKWLGSTEFPDYVAPYWRLILAEAIESWLNDDWEVT